MLNLNSVMLGSHKPRELAAFYTKVFGQVADMRSDEWSGWQIGNLFFSIGEHSEAKGKNKQPGRIILNFEVDNLASEFERIKELGAKVVKAPYHPTDAPSMYIATFTDPDGNYFQLMSPGEF
jgi:predicted enzyme related to lactoylglutathione lyase